MRSLALPILLSSVVVFSGCATPSGPNCEVANVPPGAVFGAREGMEIASYPGRVPRGGTGCQRVWYGERSRPGAMQILATYYYEAGEVRRLAGRVPGGATYDCRYKGGELDRSQSQNPAQCPKASEIDQPGEAGERPGTGY